MNKQFIILTGVLTLILIGVIIATSLFRITSDTQNPDSSTFAIPTTAPIPRTPQTQGVPTQTVSQKPSSTFSRADLVRITQARQQLPLSENGLSIDYSALLDTFFIQNTATNDAALKAFLDRNNLRDLHSRSPEKFRMTSKSPAVAMQEAELEFLQNFDHDDDSNTVSAPTTNPNIQNQQQTNRSVSFNTLVSKLFSFQAPKPTLTPRLNLVIAGSSAGTPTTPTSSPSSPQTTPQPTSGTLPQPTSPPVILTSGDTTQIPCSAGRDQGVADGYRDGKLYKIRICRVQGMNVNSQVSKQVEDMINAARSAGIYLTGGSFRDMNGQIAIYQSWCKRDGIVGSPPPYPKAPGQTIRCPGGGAPGYSNHQMGTAIDFNCDGNLIPKSYSQASQNKCFKWLQSNASRYGFYEYGMGKDSSRSGSGYEGWHWSVNGN